MRYYYDTEFKEDGYTVDLISIGIVAEDGREFYGVSNEFDKMKVAQDWWLMENVMSSIEHETSIKFDSHFGVPYRWLTVTDKDAKSRQELADGIKAFVGDDIPEWWAWYSAYDHVTLMQLLWGPMVKQPPGWPFNTMDIAQLAKSLGNPAVPRQPAGKHNALEDARWNVVRYDFLMDLKNSKQYNRSMETYEVKMEVTVLVPAPNVEDAIQCVEDNFGPGETAGCEVTLMEIIDASRYI